MVGFTILREEEMTTGNETETTLPEGEVTVQIPETKSYTQEELDAFVEQAKQEEFQKYQGIQRTVAKKDQELEQLRRQAPQAIPNTTLKGIVDEIERLQTREDYSPDPASQSRIAQLKGEIVREEQRVAQQQAYAQMDAIANQWRERLDQKIRDAGFDPSDDKFDGVNDAFTIANSVDGKFEKAEARLDRILGKAKPTQETKPKESEEEKINRLADEKYTQKLKDEGLYKTDTGSPSGAGSAIPTNMANFKKWIENVPQDVYEKQYAKDIEEMMRQGKIK